MATARRPGLARWVLRGLALAALAVILLFGGFTWMTFRSYAREWRAQEQLDAQFGRNAPPLFEADGSIAPARLARLVEVRRVLAPLCADVTGHQDAFTAVETVADGPDSEEKAGVLFARAWDAAARMPRMVRGFTTYINARNAALLEREMGLAEYAALYTLAYVSWLGQDPVPLMAQTRENVFETRIYPELAGLIQAHAQADGSGAGEAAADARLALWRDEARRLQADPRERPFRGGLPPELAASFQPLRDELARLSCPAAAELDVVRTIPRSVMGYDHR